MQIIGLIGMAQAGKTVLSKEIERVAFEAGMSPIKMSFAGALKRAAAMVGADKETNPDLYRRLCQDIGANLRDPDYVPGVTNVDYWVKLVGRQITEMEYDGDGGLRPAKMSERVLIFDDIRFSNELELLKKSGAVMIYIDRGEELPDPEARFRLHSSEAVATQMKTNKQYSRDMGVTWTLDSSGSMDAYLTRARPYIPVWLGLQAPPTTEEVS